MEEAMHLQLVEFPEYHKAQTGASAFQRKNLPGEN